MKRVDERARPWKIGELARSTGISVRMLRHYDEIGLCSPSSRSASGYRLYSAEDVARLQKIVSLRQVGFSLAEIGELLAGQELPLEQVLELHLDRLDRTIRAQERLRNLLRSVQERVRAAETISTDDFIHIIEATTMFEKYYTPEQLAELKERADELGEEGMMKAQKDWAELGAAVRAEMERGTDPTDPRVQELARRWNDLVRAFTGGNPEIERAVQKVWENEGERLAREYGTGGFDAEMGEYIARATASM